MQCIFVSTHDGYECRSCGVPSKRGLPRNCSGVWSEPARASQPFPPGPGTHLSRLIARFQRVLPWWDMQPHEGCGCNDTARWMDRLGPDGCEEKIDVIVDRLETEAKKRKITFPFRRAVAKKLVRWAIRRARKDMI
jgi:hypothetical protein